MSVIHCLGDSHCVFFSGQEEMQPEWPGRSVDLLEGFRTYRIAPFLAHSMPNKLDAISSVISEVLHDGESLMFCFGEIDCRSHVKKQSEIQNKSVVDIIENVVHRYLSSVETIRVKYGMSPDKIIIWNVIAAVNYEGYPESLKTAHPYYGTIEERNYMASVFNIYLKYGCVVRGFFFLDVFNKMVESNGQTKDGIFLPDGIHLSQYLMPFVLEVLRVNKIDNF